MEKTLLNKNKVMSSDDIISLQEELLFKKSSVFHINKILEPLIKKHEEKTFLDKIKNHLGYYFLGKKNKWVIINALIGVFALLFIPALSHFYLISFNIFKYIIMIVINLPLFIMILLYFSKNNKSLRYNEVYNEIVKDKLNNIEVNKELLMEILVYLTDEDINLIKNHNINNKKITIGNIRSIVFEKERWINENSKDIHSLIKMKENDSILN